MCTKKQHHCCCTIAALRCEVHVPSFHPQRRGITNSAEEPPTARELRVVVHHEAHTLQPVERHSPLVLEGNQARAIDASLRRQQRALDRPGGALAAEKSLSTFDLQRTFSTRHIPPLAHIELYRPSMAFPHTNVWGMYGGN